MRAIDLCAGAGGMSLGFQRAGWDVLGVERDGDAWRTHRENVGPCRLADITEFRPATQFDAAIGGVPCQGFSMAGLRMGSSLFRHLIRIGVEANVRALMLENVEGMVTWRDKDPNSGTFGQTMPNIISCAMRDAGYSVEWRVINCAAYGTPQLRKRIIFVALRYSAPFQWPSHTHGPDGSRPFVSVREALGLVGEYRSGVKESASGGYQGMRYLNVDAPSPTAGTRAAELLNPLDKPAPCITATEGKSSQNFGANGAKTKPRRATERLDVAMRAADRPAPTIKANSSHEGTGERTSQRPSGELQDDLSFRLTPEDLAILQGFPSGFKFYGNKTAQFRQIGNAFPPQPAEALARALANALRTGTCQDCGEPGPIGACAICDATIV